MLFWLLLPVAAAFAAVSLNVLLLGRATQANDPVGHLSSRARLPAAPHWTVRPVRSRVESRGFDD
jgi:hypothetical protein